MKKAVSLMFILLSGVRAQAQSATITFANDNNSLISNGLTGELVKTNDYIRAQLYYAPDGVTDEAAFVMVGTPAPVGTPPGRYNGGSKLIPTSEPGAIMIQVRAYEFLYGNSYEEAEAAGVVNGRPALLGKSAIARAIPGGGPTNGSSRVVGPFTVNLPGGGAYFGVNDITVAEGSNGVVNANFRVSLSTTQSQPVSVDFSTLDGTALAGQDYVATNGTVTFEPGQTSKTVAVLLTADAPAEPDERFYLTLSNPVNGLIVRSQGTCLITEVRITNVSVDTTVGFNTVLNRRYVVEKTADLVNWQPVAGATNVLGTGGIVNVFDRGNGCAGMVVYRARLLDQ